MPRKKRKPPKRTATRKPRVAKLKVTVVLHPESSVGQAKHVTLKKEIGLIRAAVLYADEVEVVSPATEMLLGVKRYIEQSDAPMFDVLRNLDTETLVSMGFKDSDQTRQLFELLPALQSGDLFPFLESVGYEGVDDLRRMTDEVTAHMASTKHQAQAQIEEMYTAAGAPELGRALKTGFVHLSPLFQSDDTWDADVLVERYVEKITELLTDGSRHMLLDDPTAQMARLLIEEKGVSPSALTLPNATQSVVGVGMLARLPTFGDTPVDELLDMRRDLLEPLVRYRRAVAQLGEKMRVGALDVDVDAEVDHLFRTEVEPALLELREMLTEHGLAREFAKAIGADLKELIWGLSGSGALILGATAVTDLATAATNAIASAPSIAGAASVFTRARNNQRDVMSDIKKHDLYYLHEVESQLSRKPT